MNEANQLKKLMETIDHDVTEGRDFNVKHELYAEMRTLMDFIKKSTDMDLLAEVYNEVLEAQQKLASALENFDDEYGVRR